MTTDRELLEGAAKAAGCVYLMNGQLYVEGKGNIDWNPLTDDGDALRLAVKLKMLVQVDYSDSFRYVTSAKCWSREIERCVFASEEVEPCPYNATRRAIVRAAYEVSIGMRPFPTVEEIEQFAGMDGKPEFMK